MLSPDYIHQLSLMARQMAKKADKDPQYNDAADTLYVACVKLGVPNNLLPR